MELLTASGAAIDGLRIAGLISMALGAGHVAFPRLFGWAREFSRISELNVRVFATLHWATTFFLVGAGLLTFRYAALLAEPREPATAVCLLLALFWAWRLIWQVAYFRPSRLAHDQRLLALHHLLILLFVLLVAGYSAPLLL